MNKAGISLGGALTRITGAGLVLMAGILIAADAIPPAAEPGVRQAATGPATTRSTAASLPIPYDVEETTIIRRMSEAGDPRIIPIINYWLAVEQDGQAIGFGSPRLRAATYAADNLRYREAAPLILSAYDSPTANGDARSYLAAAAIRLDPANVAFCRQVLGEEFNIERHADNPGQAAASAVLALAGDEEAAKIFVRGYAAYLDSVQAGREDNRSFHRQLAGISDLKFRARLLALKPKYPANPALNVLLIDTELIRMNGRTQDERLKIALNPDETESQRYLALTSLGHTGDPDALKALEAAEPWRPAKLVSRLAGTRPATRPITLPTSAPTTANAIVPAAPTPQPGSTQPTTRSLATTGRAAATMAATTRPVTGSTQWAIDQIREHHRLGKSSENPPVIAGLVFQPLAEGERVMRMAAIVYIDGKPTSRSAGRAGRSPSAFASALGSVGGLPMIEV